ncbi:MAG: hypothetical protein AVDCRST_MAG13-3116, partial [uncultured Solirubrobacteraceae bacterium]
ARTSSRAVDRPGRPHHRPLDGGGPRGPVPAGPAARALGRPPARVRARRRAAARDRARRARRLL